MDRTRLSVVCRIHLCVAVATLMIVSTVNAGGRFQGETLKCLPKGSYILLKIPETTLVCVNTEEGWNALVKHNSPGEDPRSHYGAYIYYHSRMGALIEGYMFIPTYESFYKGKHRKRHPYEELMMSIGHETLHAIDAWLGKGKEIWQPDRMEVIIRGGSNGSK